jgi:hypothetical protein
MGNSKHGALQGSILWSLLFIICINDLPPTVNTFLFADETSVIISSKIFDNLFTVSNTLLFHMSKWFKSNKLVLNLDKLIQ